MVPYAHKNAIGQRLSFSVICLNVHYVNVGSRKKGEFNGKNNFNETINVLFSQGVKKWLNVIIVNLLCL
jgi:hypothetical protein